MQETTLTICNQLGLHARACAALVSTASRFSSESWLTFEGKKANAKSIMNLLVLGATYGQEITLSVEGDDEQAAFEAIGDLINNRFGEES